MYFILLSVYLSACLLCVCVCVSDGGYVHISTGTSAEQKRASDPLELEW